VAHALWLNNASMQCTDIASSANKATIFGCLCDFPSAICFYLHPNYRLSMGAKSQFTEEQNSWLNPVMAEFKAKLTQATGGSSKDDSLLDWKKAKCEDFLREFKIQLEATDDSISVWREVCFITIFLVAYVLISVSACHAALHQH
jgi:hypothetical protein